MDLNKISKGKVKVYTDADKKAVNVLNKFSVQDMRRDSVSGGWWFLREGKAYYVSPEKQVVDLGLSGMESLPDSITEEKEGDTVKMSVFLNTIQALDRIRGETIEGLLMLVDPSAEYVGREGIFHQFKVPDGSGTVKISINDEPEEEFINS